MSVYLRHLSVSFLKEERDEMVALPIIVAYYAAWSIYSRSYFVSEIPVEKITHINYAFANIGTDGKIALGDPWADVEKAFGNDRWDQPLRGNFNQLLRLKEKHPHLRTLISIGGWVNRVSLSFDRRDMKISSRHGRESSRISL